VARIKIAGKTRHLGVFEDLADAAAAREAAAAEEVTLMGGKQHSGGTRANVFAMQARHGAVFAIVEEIQPCSVRQAFYQCVMRGVIDKTEQGYMKVQTALVMMRREGRVPYGWITDGTRWRFKPDTFDSVEQALHNTARFYCKGCGTRSTPTWRSGWRRTRSPAWSIR
jgi:hypothetical protein